ncbi:MAG: bactofilin family protein [Alphaproteobacteria bacterium]
MFTRKSGGSTPPNESKENELSKETAAPSSDAATNVSEPPAPAAPAPSRIPQKPVAPHIPGAMPPQASAPMAGTSPRPPEPPQPGLSAAQPVPRPAPTMVDDTEAAHRKMPEPSTMPHTGDLYSPHQSSAGAYPTASSSRLTPSDQGSDLGRLIVGKDIELKGEVKNCDLLVVEGTVEAVLVNTRSLEVTADGIFRGTAPVETAEISGLVEGDLIVEGHVFVRSSGIVNGNIEFGELEIERGGRVRGSMTQFGEKAEKESTSSPRANRSK